MTIALVVLSYNGNSMLYNLISDIHQKASKFDELILVDNGSEETEVWATMQDVFENSPMNVKIFRQAENLGFGQGMNFGIQQAKSDIIAIISNDVRIVSGNLYESIRDLLSVEPKALIGQVVYTQNTGWNMFGNITVPYAEGWFLAAKKDFWDIHRFDPRYGISDFEDVDLSMQAVKAGYSLYYLHGRHVEHLGGRTIGYTDERFARTKGNKIKFAEKWRLA